METWGDQKGWFLLDLEGEVTEVNRGTTRIQYSFTPSASVLIPNVLFGTERLSQAVLDD